MADNKERARQARQWLRADVIEECAGGNHATEKAIVRRESGEFLGEAHDVIQDMAVIILDLVARLAEREP